MKKLFLILMTTYLTLSINNNLSAQMELGGELGLSISNGSVIGDYGLIPNLKPYAGIKAGLNASYKLSPIVTLESGLLYHNTGFRISENINFDLYKIPIQTGITAIASFDYLETPLLLKLNTTGSKVQFTGAVGPYVGLAIDGEVRTRAKLLLDFSLGKYDLNLRSNYFNQWEIGLMSKVGIKIPLNNSALQFSAYYQHGLNDLTDEPILDVRTRRFAYGLSGTYVYSF